MNRKWVASWEKITCTMHIWGQSCTKWKLLFIYFKLIFLVTTNKCKQTFQVTVWLFQPTCSPCWYEPHKLSCPHLLSMLISWFVGWDDYAIWRINWQPSYTYIFPWLHLIHNVKPTCIRNKRVTQDCESNIPWGFHKLWPPHQHKVWKFNRIVQ